MYSQNDYRDYLEHKWTWPGGKNSKEYNAHYYQTHKEKWDKYKKNIKEGLNDVKENVYDALGGKEKREAEQAVQDFKKKEQVYDASVALDARYLTNKTYNNRLRAEEKWEKLANEAEQALLRYQDTPLGKLDEAITFGKNVLEGRTSWWNASRSWVNETLPYVNENHRHEKRKENIISKDDPRYAKYH